MDGRHQRALLFWTAALSKPDCERSLTPTEAFEVGREAWKADAGLRQHEDFSNMIAGVPIALRMAALNGWLNAFDDEEIRLRTGQT